MLPIYTEYSNFIWSNATKQSENKRGYVGYVGNSTISPEPDRVTMTRGCQVAQLIAVKLHLCWWHRLRQSLVSCLSQKNTISWHLWWIICCNPTHPSLVHLIFLQGYPALALPNAVINFFHEFRHKFPLPRNQGWNREHQNDESPMGRCLVAHHPSKRRQCLVGNTPNQDIPSKPWVLREVLKCSCLIKIPKMNGLNHNSY